MDSQEPCCLAAIQEGFCTPVNNRECETFRCDWLSHFRHSFTPNTIAHVASCDEIGLKTVKEIDGLFSMLAITMVEYYVFCPIPSRKFVIPYSNNDGWLARRQIHSIQKHQTH